MSRTNNAYSVRSMERELQTPSETQVLNWRTGELADSAPHSDREILLDFQPRFC